MKTIAVMAMLLICGTVYAQQPSEDEIKKAYGDCVEHALTRPTSNGRAIYQSSWAHCTAIESLWLKTDSYRKIQEQNAAAKKTKDFGMKLLDRAK